MWLISPLNQRNSPYGKRCGEMAVSETVALTNGQPPESKIEFLKKMPIFAGLAGGALEDLNKIAAEYEFQRGAIIAHQNDVSETLYIVRSGELEAFHIDENRHYHRLDTYNRGQFFNDIWLFEPNVHPATVRARQAGRLILINSKDFLKWLKMNPKALNALYPHFTPPTRDVVIHSRFQSYLDKGISQRIPRAPRPAETKPEDQPNPAQPAAAVAGTPPPEEITVAYEPNPEKAQQYAKLGLLPEEVVLFDAQRSIKLLYFRAGATAAFCLTVFLISLILLGTSLNNLLLTFIISAVITVIPLFNLLAYYINWRNCYFILTNQHVIRYEFKLFKFSSDIERVDVDKIQTVSTITPGLLANWLKIGTAAITTSAQSNVIYFDFIDTPKDVETAIHRINERNSAIGASQRRAKLRAAVEATFNLPKPMKEIKPPADTKIKPKGFLKRMQEHFVRSEENGVITYHKHPIALIRPVLGPSITLVVLLISFYVVYFLFDTLLTIPGVVGLFVILFLVDLAWLAWQIEDWRNDTYQITDQYIYDVDRLPFGFNERRKQADLGSIENVRAEKKGLMANVFSYGNVHAETAGSDANIIFENVRDPDKIQKEIFAKRENHKKKTATSSAKQQQDEYTILIDMYYQAVQQGRIPGHRPLPPIEDEEEPENSETA